MTSILWPHIVNSVIAAIMIGGILLVQKLYSKTRFPVAIQFLWGVVLLFLLASWSMQGSVQIVDSLFGTERGAVVTTASATSLIPSHDTSVEDENEKEQYPYQNNTADKTQKYNFANLLSPQNILLTLWLTGAAGVLCQYVIKMMWFSANVRRSRIPITDAAILEIVYCYGKQRSRRHIDVWCCDLVQAPTAFGCFRPCILLPSQFIENVDPDTMGAALIHEIEHVRCGDIPLKYVWAFAKALHWFNPLVWIACKQIRYDIERLCDQRVIGSVFNDMTKEQSADIYCRALFCAAEFISENARKQPLLANPMIGEGSHKKEYLSKNSQLERRVTCIMNPEKHSMTAITLTTVLAFAILFTGLMVACQPTPEKPAVIGRQEDILEVAESTDFEKIEVPKHFSKVYDSFDKLAVTLNADVIVPDVNAYPLVEVKPQAISIEQIASLVELCIDGNYELYSDYRLSKTELSKMLNEVEQYNGIEGLTTAVIQSLREAIANAPEETEAAPAELDKLPVGISQALYAKRKDGTMSIFIVARDSNTFCYSRNVNSEYIPESMLTDEQFDEVNQTWEQFMWQRPGTPEISRQDAYKIVSQYIATLGVDLDLYTEERCTILTNVINKTTGWRFTFMRSISGLRNLYDKTAAYINPYALPSYASPWPMESLQIVIDKDGLCELMWQGACEIDNTVIESAQMESFDFIQERIAKQINYVYGTHENEAGVGLDIEVTKIELGISLMSLKNRPEAGIYIPTWYVSFNRKWRDSSEYLSPLQIMLSGIDGSYIEPRVTNQEIMANTQP